jgi:hypothetical protein
MYDQEPMSLCKLYLFDQTSQAWYQWDKIWSKMSAVPPTPTGVYAGIGSRDMTEAGIAAINALYKS